MNEQYLQGGATDCQAQREERVTYNGVCNSKGNLALTVPNLPTMWGKGISDKCAQVQR